MNSSCSKISDKNTHIAIIGAGPSGLAAAERLKELGYQNIELLEKNPRPGGMACSGVYKTRDGKEIVYDLGSIQPVSTGVGAFHKLLKKYDMHLGRGDHPNKPMYLKLYYAEKNQYIVDFTKHTIGYPAKYLGGYVLDMMKLIKYLIQYRALASSHGHGNVPDNYLEELYIPLYQWVDNANFRVIGDSLKYIGTGVLGFANPKYKNEISAFKFLKLIHQFLKFPPRYLNGSFKLMREGYQELWNRIAKNHHVVYHTHIEKVDRDNQGVNITFDGKTKHYDKVIISCSLTHASEFLQMTAEEKPLFTNVRYCPGWRVIFSAKHLPHDCVYSFADTYFNENHEPFLSGFMPEGQIDQDTWLYSAFFYANNMHEIDIALENTKTFLRKKFNAEIVEWVQKAYWPEYAPHYTCEEVKNGNYKKLESLQGKNNTYITGGILSGGTNALATNYSYDMIDRFFE